MIKDLQKFEGRLVERFLEYVKIDTQSDSNSDSSPSTLKQFDLANVLVAELLSLGIENAHVDDFGYVYAFIKSNSDKKDIPKIAFCSHLDTSPDCSGNNVKPIIHKNYQGNDIILPFDDTIIKYLGHPDLENQLGNDIITSSGDTLLAADNKAGIAEIMTAVDFILKNEDFKHGDVNIVFTPDEEIGRGADLINLKKLNSDFGYTIDGETLGSIENETFSADAVEVSIYGQSMHPGFAKNKLVSALKIASEIVARLPKISLSPETTEDKEGFIHPTDMAGNIEMAKISFIIRDFEEEGLAAKENFLKNLVEEVCQGHSCVKFEVKVTEQYRNMKVVLDQYPKVIDNSVLAIKQAGLNPKLQSIRGGTDGSRLSFMGLPCPNIFAGEHAFHSKQEWVSINDMLMATLVILNIIAVWEAQA